jgi:hypothetical protein
MTETPVVRRYRRRELDIEACQFIALNQREVADWCGGLLTVIPRNNDESRPELVISIDNIGGKMLVHLGDYVIKVGEKLFFSCKSEEFDSMYEVIEDGA